MIVAHCIVHVNHFTIVILECEENICENGGSCSIHAGDYRCDCPAGFSGFLCDEGILITS